MTRFWNKVHAFLNPSLCWVWMGAKDRCGYGQFRIDRKTLGSHRVAWELVNGSIPQGMHVLHQCDNPSCVNVTHLFLGTHADNIRDRNAKGKQPSNKGENNPSAKITFKQAREIRSRYLTRGETQQEIAREFGLCQTRISRIVNGKSWHGA